jgi:hypothetical protein
VNIDRAACVIATGRLLEARDLLVRTAAAAAAAGNVPGNAAAGGGGEVPGSGGAPFRGGVGGSSVGTTRRVALALRALGDLLERFTTEVKDAAKALQVSLPQPGGGGATVGEAAAAAAAAAAADEKEKDDVVVRLLPIRLRSRGERHSLRTFPVVTLHPRFPFNVRLTGETFD